MTVKRNAVPSRGPTRRERNDDAPRTRSVPATHSEREERPPTGMPVSDRVGGRPFTASRWPEPKWWDRTRPGSPPSRARRSVPACPLAPRLQKKKKASV
ncbi:hypothetical protein TNCV_1087711 [Trichonephila clavipes]|uniref:Uncharacterized protein n=1 Tax=Trichonephila clavipes TaxID=2585209 RepID=A0A8X6SWY9_TRICX|nr:hypothetical protein TNCV_1087711 [Trichonephila clavipes]